MFGLLGARAAQFGGGAPAPITDFIPFGNADGPTPWATWALNGGATIASGTHRLFSLDDSGVAPTRVPLKRTIGPDDASLSLLVDVPALPGGAFLRINLYRTDGGDEFRMLVYQGNPALGVIAESVAPDDLYTHLEFVWFEAGIQISRVQLLP